MSESEYSHSFLVVVSEGQKRLLYRSTVKLLPAPGSEKLSDLVIRFKSLVIKYMHMVLFKIKCSPIVVLRSFYGNVAYWELQPPRSNQGSVFHALSTKFCGFS